MFEEIVPGYIFLFITDISLSFIKHCWQEYFLKGEQ